MDIITLVSIIGTALGIAGTVWGVVMRPFKQKQNELQETLDDHEGRLRATETKTTEHSIQIGTMTTSINQLVAKIDIFVQQLMDRR